MKRQDPLPAILNAADLSNPALANPAVAAQVAFASQGVRLKNKTSEKKYQPLPPIKNPYD